MKNKKQLFSNQCWVSGRLQPATISIEDGKISDIQFSKKEGAEDFGSLVIMPALIDAHVHINEPGRTHWEGFDTATRAAAAGGIGTLIDMPLNASPVTTNQDAFAKKLEAANGLLHVNVGFYGGLIPGNTSDLAALARAGVFGFKCFLTHSGIDEFPNVALQDLEQAMPVIAQTGLPLLVHCELDDDQSHFQLHESPTNYAAYLASRPARWEEDAVAMMIGLCKKYQCKTHIVHVSSAGSLPLIANAKAEGLPLTAETCAHYILFSAENIADGNTLFKCAPPIRDRANNNLLIEALKAGVLDFITTDHSPAPPGIKKIDTGDFKNAWGGIAGLQFLLSSAFTAVKDWMSLEEFIPLVTGKPALFLGLQNQKGFLQKGADADIVIWDPGAGFLVEEKNTQHRHIQSPFTGMELYGLVHQTMIGGNLVYQEKKLIHKNAGQCLLKK